MRIQHICDEQKTAVTALCIIVPHSLFDRVLIEYDTIAPVHI